MEDLIGRVLGNRYEIIEKIGGGGMAVVYKAKCRLLNRFVAVKILRTDSEMTEDFIKRFKVEAQAAGSLSHPNVVSIYDVGTEGDINYIVMEYVEGYTLKEVITKSDKLTWRAAVKIATQICAGLEHAHKNHIIHRDIKSQNILVNSDLVAKVTDFGIARATSNSTITMAGNTIGSVHYFSPEQAKGQHTDEKSDIYSLGIVMYEMLTGRVPFDADTPVSVALKQIQELPVPPERVDSSVPSAVSDIVLKALQKEPRLRYQSSTELLKDLQAVLENPENIIVADKNIGATTVINSVNENMINERANKPVPVKEDKTMSKKNVRVNILAFLLALICVGAGTFFLGSAVIKFYFGGSKDVVDMPNLVGKTVQEAEAELKDKNILIKKRYYANSDDVEKNYIISQYPVGIAVRENVEIVELTISNGRGNVMVPNVVNLTKEDAMNKLDSAELRYSFEEQTSEEVPRGSIIKQNPISGKYIESGSMVELYVSSGAEVKMVEVPNIIGKTPSNAKRALEASGLKYGKVTNKANKSKTNGVILSQSIDEGEEVESGTTVDVVVNKLNEDDEDKPKDIPQKSQTMYLNLSNKGIEGSTFEVRVEMSGAGVVGRKIIYRATHKREDEEVAIKVTGNGTAMIYVYIDDQLDSAQELNLV